MYFMVAENKSLPGREDRKPGEAIGRHVSVVFFEKVSDVADGALVQHCNSWSVGASTSILFTRGGHHHSLCVAPDD